MSLATDTVSNFSILRTGAGDDAVTGTASTETFYDGAGDDVYNGGGGSDIFYAGAGNDTITGGNCPTYNQLYGAAGDDIISGTNNGNGIYGGTGSDTLTGGSGADDFFFMASDNFDGVDTITNFDTGEGDEIDISDILSGYNHGTDDIDDFVAFVVSGGDVRIEIDVDGTGTDSAFAAVAIVTGGAALDMDTLIAASDLIIV